MELFESFISAGQRGAGNGGSAGQATKGSPAGGAFDENKHPRGARGSGSGGKFISAGAGSSTQVRTIQHKLGIATDGKYGPKTTKAVEDYQRRHGLKPDGVVGRQTAAALAGRKNAKNVKPGALSAADRRELAAMRRHQVRKRARLAESVDVRDVMLTEIFNSSLHRRGPHGEFANMAPHIDGGSGGHNQVTAPRPVTASKPRPAATRTVTVAKPPMPKGVKVAMPRENKPAGVKKLSEDELPGHVGTGGWDKGVKDAVAALQSGKSKDTESHHMVDGKYTPDRVALHGRILSLLVQHAEEHPNDAKALFLAGGAASGKSSLEKHGAVDHPHDAVTVNPDVIRTMLPEYQHLVDGGDRQAAAKTHEESSYLAKELTKIAVARKYHLIVDGVGGGKAGKFAGKVAAIKNAGYDTHVAYVSVPTDTAWERAAKRAERTGRHVPRGPFLEGHRTAPARLPEVLKIPGVNVDVYDNSGAKPKRVASSGPKTHALTVHDRKGYDAFVAKSRL